MAKEVLQKTMTYDTKTVMQTSFVCEEIHACINTPVQLEKRSDEVEKGLESDYFSGSLGLDIGAKCFMHACSNLYRVWLDTAPLFCLECLKH